MTTSRPSSAQRFRPEIQFLRALAVVAVVIYHINPAWLPGGFVGVDVFFVISGFLITAGILNRIETTGQFSLMQFWANRARRILPAATVTIVVVSVLSLWLLPLTRLKDVATQGIASALYIQNFTLARQSVDYMAADAKPTPFQHFWSLSLEEQFYVVWPLLVVVAGLIAGQVLRRYPTGFYQHRRRFRGITVVFFSVFVAVSFIANVVHVTSGDPAAYFVTWTRLWELGAGGLLACVLIEWTSRPRLRLALQWVGIAAIVISAVMYSAATPFPGVAALLPIAGTVAVIAAGTTSGVGSPDRFMRLAPIQRVGDWSYSLYLWHFPVVVFAGARIDGGITVLGGLLIFAVSLVLACASYYLVERPILSWTWLKTRHAHTVVGAVVVAAVGAVVAVVPGWVSAYELRQQNLRDDVLTAPTVDLPTKLAPGFGSLREYDYDVFFGEDTTIEPAPINARESEPKFPECSFEVPVPVSEKRTRDCVIAGSGGERTIAVVGDSHAAQWVPALRKVIEGTDWRVVVYLRQKCPFTVGAFNAEWAGGLKCQDANRDVVERLKKERPEVVLTSGLIRGDAVAQDGEKVPGTKGFANVFRELSGGGTTVLAFVDSPNPPGDMPECVSENLDDPSACDFKRSDAKLDQGTNAAMREAAREVSDVELVETADAFCVKDVCPAVAGSRLVYRDTNHVSPAYAETLEPWLGSIIDEIGRH